MIGRLATVLQARGVVTLSIKMPTDAPVEGDPRGRHTDKFLVSWKTGEMQIKWSRGKLAATLTDALLSAFPELLVLDL